jgi:hypothetical protein
MKIFGPIAFVILVMMSGISCSSGSGKSTSGDAVIAFDTLSHDFGEVRFGDEAEFEFVFTNSGKAPLIVTHVKSTCGCTVPDWSREPVNARKRGSVYVTYDTHRMGVFTKSIYVYSNAANGVQQLHIKGKVTSPGV